MITQENVDAFQRDYTEQCAGRPWTDEIAAAFRALLDKHFPDCIMYPTKFEPGDLISGQQQPEVEITIAPTTWEGLDGT